VIIITRDFCISRNDWQNDKFCRLGDFIAVNHFTKEGGLFEFDSNDITENLIKSRNELMNAYEGLFLSELYNPENDG
jgi:hypothetical protein